MWPNGQDVGVTCEDELLFVSEDGEFIDMCTKGDNAHKSKKTSASDSTSKNSNMLYISSLNQQ